MMLGDGGSARQRSHALAAVVLRALPAVRRWSERGVFRGAAVVARLLRTVSHPNAADYMCLASRRRSAAKLAVVLLTAVSAPLAGNAGAETEPGSFVAVDLGTLGGTYSHAEAVNASGGVVGYSFTRGNAEYHAFLGA